MENNFSPHVVKSDNPSKYQNASYICKIIVEQIAKLEKDLPVNMQIGGALANFGNTTFTIDKLEFIDPNIIVFSGSLPDGSTVRLMQNVSQLNLLLYAVARSTPEKPRRKIGFAPYSE